MLKRYANNPIITGDPSSKWYPKKVYNPTVVKKDNRYYMLFRGVGEDWISRILLATSDNGVDFKIEPEPVIFPENPWENRGCEDPRMVYIDGKYFTTYTAYDGKTARIAMASSPDLYHWQKHNLLFPRLAHPQRENLPVDWSKAAAILPETINGRYYLLFGDNHIWPAMSDDFMKWHPISIPIISARAGLFDAAYVEMGPPPIHTAKGWLVFYHGIDEISDTRTYRLGAALLSLNDPMEVLWRCNKPILEPEEKYETIGYADLIPGGYQALRSMSDDDINKLAEEDVLPKAVFCCGAILEDDNVIRLYYGAGDTRICTATVDLETILAS
jgi:predicted GH43/DUF377 family glycosyl hydrolase